jgi:microcin C transport system permease protein
MILPIIAWSISSFAGLTILMKNSLLENISQDYIRTAFAKGLQEKRVIWVHAIRNSIIPIASGIGGVIGVVIAGSYLIEKVFNIDGFGKMGFQAILDRDYPITLGFLVIVVVIRLVSNILSDIALATVDPRIRFK